MHRRILAVFLAFMVCSGFVSAGIVVSITYPAGSGKTSFSKTLDASCGQASACLSQAVSIGGSSFPATGFFACPGHPEVTENLLIDTVGGVHANYTRDQSFWEFFINGASASVGPSCYFVSEGDVIALSYNGAYTGPTLSTPTNMQNACINARRAGWTGSQWPDVCGDEKTWEWEKPFTSYLIAGEIEATTTTSTTSTTSSTLSSTPAPSTTPTRHATATPSTPTPVVLQHTPTLTGWVVAHTNETMGIIAMLALSLVGSMVLHKKKASLKESRASLRKE